MAIVETRSFDALLRRYRLAAELTQEQLAARANLSVRGISNLERGVRRAPRLHTVRQLADALGLLAEERAHFFEAARAGDRSPHETSDRTLVDRVAELDAIERHLAGHGAPVLLLAGEPGIGKSRLLQEAVERAPAHDLTALHGASQRRTAREPYAPFPEMIGRYLGQQTAAMQKRTLAGCAWLARLVPEVLELTEAPPWFGELPPEQERRLAFAAVRRFLANVAGHGGTLLVLDDIHWMGPEALDLLTALVAERSDPPLRVLGAYRDTEARGAAVSALLAELGERGLASQITLGPLSREDSAALLDQLISQEVDEAPRQAILERAGGSPFFLLSCAQAVDRDGWHVPWSVTQSVRQRLAALSQDAQTILQAAAVTGRVVLRSVVMAVAEIPETRVRSALDEACRARLLIPESDREYRFAHDLVRDVIEADIGVARRALLHRQVAEALERLPDPARLPRAAEIAWHYLQSDDRERALPFLLAAGDEAASLYAHGEAERQYREALGLGRESDDATGSAAALEKLGGVLVDRARYDEALTVLEEAAGIYRTAGDLEGEGRVAALMGMAHRERGTPEEGIAQLQRVLSDLEARGPSHTLTSLHVTLGHALFVAGRYEESAQGAERAAELARALRDVKMLAEANARLGACLTNLCDNDAAVRVLEEAVPLAEAAGDLRTLAIAATNLGVAYDVQGQIRPARACYERAIEVIERLENPAWMALALENLGRLLFQLGDWERARELEERAVEELRAVSSWVLAYPLRTLAQLHLASGEWDKAAGELETALRVAQESGDPMALHGVQACLAELDLLKGRPEGAWDRLEPLLPDSPGTRDINLVHVLPVMVRTCLELGEEDKAEAIAWQTLGESMALGSPTRVGEALIVKGMVLARKRRWEQAEETLEEAVALHRRLGFVWPEANTLAAWAEMYARKGDIERARSRWDEALALFRRLGARLWIQQAEKALEELEC